MTNDILDHLKSLQTSAIDARNGYQEALKQADGKGMTPLFHQTIMDVRSMFDGLEESALPGLI